MAPDKSIGRVIYELGNGQWDIPDLRTLLEDAGISVERVYRAGFPFFNLYKIAVVVRSRQLIREFDGAASKSGPSRFANMLLQFFDKAFRWNLRSSPFGWQLLAVGRVRQSLVRSEGGV